MQFSPSPRGHHLLAYNSSRICVIDLRGRDVVVKRELKILRRPAATCIKDDGSLLAVLLTEMQVDFYDLTRSPPRRTQSIILDHPPRAIALSPCGSVLAAAYEGGIEVSSLSPAALATDRRAVKCDAVDSLAFSFDGTQILGTTVHSAQPNTVIITAPYYDPGSHMPDDSISPLWTTSILFPNTSRDCSHAVLLQNSSREEASWTFTYDRSFETFRAVRIGDLRNGTTYFTGPIPSQTAQGKLLPCTLPAASYYGELVAAGFQGSEIWLYGVPEDLDAVPEPAPPSSEGGSSANSLNSRNSGPSVRSASRMQEPSAEARVPQWQILCDKLRNTFVGGRKIGELCGVNSVKWVEGFGDSSLKERLVVAARGVLPPKPISEEDDGIDFIDGGRLTLIDFDYGVGDGQATEVTVEVGTAEPEVLEEEHRDMATEVAIVRRRTVAQRRGGSRSAVIRAATTAGHELPAPPPPPQLSEEVPDDPLIPRRIGAPPSRGNDAPAASPIEENESQSIIEEQEALDAPYSHASPRSVTTLRRAATAAAISRRLNPPPATVSGHIQYRRADGRAEHPHESDADNWVPPPPPYQAEDPKDLPAFLRYNVPPVSANNAAPSSNRSTRPTSQEPNLQQPPRSQTAVPTQQARASRGAPPSAHQRFASHSSVATRPATSGSLHLGRGSLVQTRDGHDDDEEGLYDVSPPDSPAPALAQNRPAVALRHASGSSAFTTATNSSGVTAPTQGMTASPSLRQAAPAAPRIQTTSASTSPRSIQPPTLDLEIPSPTLAANALWHAPPLGASPAPGRIGNSQTWPIRPAAHGAPAVLPSGYPYSAPPTDLNASDMIAQSYPPPPRPEQLASLNRHDEQQPGNLQRLSGGFQVARVPVGSRDSRRLSGNQPPHSPSRHPLQQNPPLQHPRPQRAYESRPPPPVEDRPLIISTPTGVSGAFDPPGMAGFVGREATPILAPVPRHPRANETSAVLRPTVERLETIYSVASDQQALPTTPGYLTAPPLSTRQSSLNRKQSRAERSAARNIADAKRRGWRRNKSRRRQMIQKGRDYDTASSAAWTDVTASSRGADAFRNPSEGQEMMAQKGKGGGKCIIM